MVQIRHYSMIRKNAMFRQEIVPRSSKIYSMINKVIHLTFFLNTGQCMGEV